MSMKTPRSVLIAAPLCVIPAQAGIQGSRIRTRRCAASFNALDPRLRGDDEARMTNSEASP
jgi:hypothetical protein